MSSSRGRLSHAEPVSHRVMADARNRALWELVAAEGGDPPRRLLDLGCGTCVPLREFVAARPRPHRPLAVVGLDRSWASLAADGRSAGVPVVQGDAVALPLPDRSVDLVSCFTLFSSLPTVAIRRAAADEIVRVLVPGGMVAWYDLRYPSPRNPAVTAIPARQMHALFPTCSVVSRSVSVLPPISRRLMPRWPGIYPSLVAIPPLRSHWAAVLRTPGPTAGRD